MLTLVTCVSGMGVDTGDVCFRCGCWRVTCVSGVDVDD